MTELVSLKLSKKAKKDTMEGVSIGDQEYPYGTRLRFEEDQIEKIPILSKIKAGDIGSGSFEYKVIEVNVTDRDKDKKRHRVEIQIQKIAINDKASFNDAFSEASNKKGG